MSQLQRIRITEPEGLRVHVNYENVQDGKRINFTFTLGARPRRTPRSRFFIPLKPAQIIAMREYRERLPEEKAPAYASITLNQLAETLTWRSFSPHGLDRQAHIEPFKAPVRKGIATAIHLAITKFLTERYAWHRIIHDNHIPLERTEHLRKMGIDPHRRYRIKEYYDIIRSHVRDN